VGFIFGVLQMVLYVIYKNFKTAVPMEPKLPYSIDIAKLSPVSCEMKPAVCPQSNEEDDHTDQNSKDRSSQEQPNQFEVWFEDLAS